MTQGEGVAMKRVLLATLAGLAALAGASLLHAEEVFRQGGHCLAYQAEKTMFLVADSEVIGKSCEVKARAEWSEQGDRVRFVVSLPIRSLDSDNSFGRDEDVAEILLVETHPDIRFVSEFLTQQQVREAFTQGAMELPGHLEFAGQTHSVRFPIELFKQSGTWIVTGKLVTSFTALGLEVPTVGPGGLIADARDYLELLVHLRFDRVRGMEDLLALQGVQQ